MLWTIVKVAWFITFVDDHCSSYVGEGGGWMLIGMEMNGMCKTKVYLQDILFHRPKVE